MSSEKYLLGFLACPRHPRGVEGVSKLAAVLQKRPWSTGRPELVDEQEEGEGIGPGDEAFRTVGVAILADSGRGALGKHEVQCFVEEIARVSAEFHLEFELQLGEVYVGTIDDGQIGRSIQVGLIDSW